MTRHNIGIGVSLLLLAGCSPRVFAPAANAPLLGRAHETQIAGQVGISYGAPGSNFYPPSLQVQSAYAVNDHLAAIASISGIYGDPDRKMPHSGSKIAQLSGELGAGYYLGQGKHVGKHLRFEVFGGLGSGFGRGLGTQVEDLDSSYTEAFSGKFVRVFLQPELGWVFSNVEFGASLHVRFTRFWYDSITTDSGDLPQRFVASYWGLSPVAFVRVGSENLKVELQGGFSGDSTTGNEAARATRGSSALFVTLGVRGKFGGKSL